MPLASLPMSVWGKTTPIFMFITSGLVARGLLERAVSWLVIPSCTQLLHDGRSIRIQVVRLPTLAPGDPRLLVAKSLGIANKMQDRFPTVQVSTKVASDHFHVVAL